MEATAEGLSSAIPTTWDTIRLGSIASVAYGKATPKTEGPVPVIGSGGVFGSTDIALIDEQTIVVGRKGSAGTVFRTDGPSYPSDTTFYLKWKDAHDVDFVFYAMSLHRLSGEHAKTTLPSVQRPDLESLLLPWPTPELQRGIAANLRSVEREIELTTAVIEATRELRLCLMGHVFTYGAVSEAEVSRVQLQETRSGQMPTQWQLTELGRVARIERGKFSHRPRNDPDFYGGATPFIQTGDITAAANLDGRVRRYSQTLNERGLSVSRVFPKGTIAITIAANIGHAAILEFDSAFPDSVIALTPIEVVNPEYLRLYLTTQQTEMDRLAPRGTQKNINIQFLAPWPVKLPPITEQQRIVRLFTCVDSKLRVEEERKAALQDVFNVMLAELMSGPRVSADRGVGRG